MLFAMIIFGLQLVAAGLRVKYYAGATISGHPISIGTVDSLELALHNFSGSAEVSGVLSLPGDAAQYYSFDCSFSGGQLVYVWLDDHLVCHTELQFGNSAWSTDGSVVNPLVSRLSSAGSWVVLVHVASASIDGSGTVTSRSSASVIVRWSGLAQPLVAGTQLSYDAIPSELLSPASPPLEEQRRSLQDSLKRGWNLWGYNLIGLVHLPDSSVLTTAFCQLSTGECLTATRIEDTKAHVRVGPFAIDQSYWQLYVAFRGLNTSISVVGGMRQLHLLVEPLNCAAGPPAMGTVNCSDYELVLLARYQWLRPGAVSVGADGSMTFSPMGHERMILQPTMDPSSIGRAREREGLGIEDELARSVATLRFSMGKGAVGMREGRGKARPRLAEIRREVVARCADEKHRYAAFGKLGEVKEALQAATMWNYVVSPAEYGPFLPVSRSWNFVKNASSLDWNYVIFDWDNIFATYMASLDPAAKNMAYSNFIQVIRSRTARGFVPNFSAGGTKSVDRTEPPIGAKVLLELHRKYKDVWLVQLLFDDLLRWNDFLAESRTLGPLGIVSLGSDRIDGFSDFSAGLMQGARYESGLDNSPMYDGSYFRKNLSGSGSLTVGQMALYDVGFASMFVQEAEALAALAPLAGKSSSVVTRLKTRASAQRQLITRSLWNEDLGIFVNRFWNGSFYPRISPTSFYGLMAGAATDEQAERLVKSWLLSKDHFCISPAGDFSNLHDDCFWGLPSIQRSDPAYPPLGYWRGFTWGPMAMLTYWSLQRYDHVPVVRSARISLCKQMTAMMLNMWRRHRHICENFNPHRKATECSGTRFYHWGALAGMITLIEEGRY